MVLKKLKEEIEKDKDLLSEEDEFSYWIIKVTNKGACIKHENENIGYNKNYIFKINESISEFKDKFIIENINSNEENLKNSELDLSVNTSSNLDNKNNIDNNTNTNNIVEINQNNNSQNNKY